MQTIRMIPFVMVWTLLGCQTQMTTQPKSDTARSDLQPATGAYHDAIETIATSEDKEAVLAADKVLRSGGLPAIDSLRNHLSDRRVPPSNYLTRAVTGTPDMGDHCFWLIQDMVEPPVPKLYGSLYTALNRANVGEWLDNQARETLLELQIEAASQSLELAKADFEQNSPPHAQKAIELYTERLQKLKAGVEG